MNLAEKIFGPDIGALKGKKTRRRPIPARSDLVEIPPEIKEQHCDLVLCVDIMYVNGIPMLTSIDRSIRFRSLVPLTSRTATEIYRGIDVIFRNYNNSGFHIKTIHADGEFKTLMDEVADTLSIDMNYTSKEEHVPEAERNNRMIGERIRAAYHLLPYKAIPKVMLRTLAMVCTHQLNLFPAKGGVSAYYSPHVIMSQQNWDFTKHCQVPFGAYVQGNQENNPTNDNSPRTIDAIYLRPMKNKQAGHELMNIQTGLVVTRNWVQEFPATGLVIKAVETMAGEQGIKTLKLSGRNKIPLHPADWIAGVDYQGENQNDDEDTNDEDYQDEPQEYEYEDELDDEDAYDRVDPTEIDELYSEPVQRKQDTDANPTDNVQQGQQEPENTESDDDGSAGAPEPAHTRPSRARKQTEVMNVSTHDKQSYTHCQTKKKNVTFEDQEWHQLEMRHNLSFAQVSPNPNEDAVYEPQQAMLMARLMAEINTKSTANGACFGQQYMFQKGLKKFKERGSAAASKELDQLHQRNCFTPVDVSKLTQEEKNKAVEALMFLTEKRDGSIKGRLVYNGKPTREWLSRDDAASPTAALESIMLTGIVDAKERRDTMSADIPNAFIQTEMPEPAEGEERVIMKITGVLVDLLVEMSPEVYGPYVVCNNGRKVLYVQVLRALYGMLKAALMWYEKFRKDLESVGFEFNPYDPCVANRQVHGKQHTVRFHVDDLMSSHVNKKVNDKFLKWLNKKYGTHGEVKATRGDVHDYLGMTFDFSDKGKVKGGHD